MTDIFDEVDEATPAAAESETPPEAGGDDGDAGEDQAKDAAGKPDDLFGLDSMTEEEIESAAKELGYKGKDEYRGDPKKFVDARTFLLNTGTTPGRLAENFRTIRREKEALAIQVREMQKTFKSFMEEQKETAVQKQIADYQERRGTLENGMLNALADGDKDQAGIYRAQIAKMDADMTAKMAEVQKRQQAQASGDSSVSVADMAKMEAFRATNDWFNKDADMTATMTALFKAELEKTGNDVEASLKSAREKTLRLHGKAQETKAPAKNALVSGPGASGFGASFSATERAQINSMWKGIEAELKEHGHSAKHIAARKAEFINGFK